MPWSDTPCDVEAYLRNGSRSGRNRTKRVINSKLRELWSDLYGKSWPSNMQACHHCDNPLCANPEHVFPGTQSDNIRDAVSKGRIQGAIRPGENHSQAKLTEDEVIAIRHRVSIGESQRSLGAEFGVYTTTINRIVNLKRWTHV